MGAGKSTLGKRLGELLALPFIDLDLEIEKQSGAAVTLIFEIEGEPGFREREARLLDELSRRRGVVLGRGERSLRRRIAGGSVFCFPSTRAVFRRSKRVVRRVSLLRLARFWRGGLLGNEWEWSAGRWNDC